MTKDWKLLAQALRIEIPAGELERAAESLDKLDASFRPLLGKIPLHCEPSYVQMRSPEETE